MDNNIINSTGIVNGSLDDGIVYPYLFDYPAPEVPYIPTQTEINTNNISDLQTALVEKQQVIILQLMQIITFMQQYFQGHIMI